MKTISADGTAARDARLRGRRGVPWRTVVALAAVLAYADGFWLISLRGAIGAIERTDRQFPSWFVESTTVLPVFAFAVLGAMTLALRWFGPDELPGADELAFETYFEILSLWRARHEHA